MAIGKPLLKEKDKPKRERKKTVSQLKKELDKLFSQYVRQKFADEKGYAQCYTCGARKPITDLQCGHFVSRVYLATRYSEVNTKPQCVGCNIFGKGKTAQFAAHLERDFGSSVVADLYREAQKIIKNFPFQEKIKEYQEKLYQLKLGTIPY